MEQHAKETRRPKVRVSFRWDCREVKSTEEVRVTGNCEELGNWEPANGHVLIPDWESSRSTGCWLSGTEVKLALGREVQYKYVVCDRHTGLGTCWEQRHEPRRLRPTGRHHVIEDDSGRYRRLQRQRCDSAPCSPAKPASYRSRQPAPSSPTQRSPASKLAEFERMIRQREVQLTSDDTVVAVFTNLPFTVERDEAGSWRVAEGDLLDNPLTPVSLVQQSAAERVLPSEADPGSISASYAQRVAEEPMERYAFTMMFAGWPGVFTSDPAERDEIRKLLEPHRCIPIFVDQEVATQHLEFCQFYLWPIMHNMKVFEVTGEREQPFDERKWRSFQEVNKQYALALDAHAPANAILWVHDFPLMLVAKYFNTRRGDPTTGLFFHAAFPSIEVLGCVPPRDEIIQSLLCFKCVSFQIFEYARRFLTCCQFLLNAGYSFQHGGVLTVEHKSKVVVVRADHLTLPHARLAARLLEPSVQEGTKALRERFPGKQIVASVDRGEPFAGLALKLRAFHRLLLECPQHRRSVVLYQHVIPSVNGVHFMGKDELLDELKLIAEETNHAFGMPGEPPVVTICDGPLTMDERLAVLQAASVALDTSINDGLNIMPFLFYNAHSLDRQGIAITSEFSGCSSVLTGALHVNPWDCNEIMEQLERALTMDQADQCVRFSKDHSYISTQTVHKWVNQNLVELKATQHEHTGPVRGLDAGFRVLEMEGGYRHVPLDVILRDYRQSKARVFFFDNEGTLAAASRASEMIRPYGAVGNAGGVQQAGKPPDPQVLDCLRSLVADRGNTVVLLSGREPEALDNWFGGVDGLGLCAEHGFYWVWPGTLQSKAAGRVSKRWHCQQNLEDEVPDDNQDNDWREIVCRLFGQYVKRIQGSVIDNQGCAITWNYRQVSAPALAVQIAMELARYLDPAAPDSLLASYPVEVTCGKGYVEVKLRDVDKGHAVRRVLAEMRRQFRQPVDFILCVGDDRADEDMFEVVNKLGGVSSGYSAGGGRASDGGVGLEPAFGRHVSSDSAHEYLSGDESPSMRDPRHGRGPSLTVDDMDIPGVLVNECARCHTVTVGRKISKAQYFVQDSDEVSELLNRLASQAVISSFSRFQSAPDMAPKRTVGASGDSDEDGR